MRRSGGIATPPVPSSRLTVYRLTTGSTPLTLHGRALTSGPPHPVVLGQPIGTLWRNIRARPTARSPLCRPHASVSPLQVPAAAPFVRGAHPGHACRAFATAKTLPELWEAAGARFGGMELPEAAGHSRRRAKVNPCRGNFSDTSPSPKIMKKYHRSYSTCAHVVQKNS